jgi:hypothetical protein
MGRAIKPHNPTPISKSEMLPTSLTILDDLGIPERTTRMAVIAEGASIYSHLALHILFGKHRSDEAPVR